MRYSYCKLLFVLLLSGLFAWEARAEINVVGVEKQWALYTAKDAGRTVCYIGSFPQSQSGNYSKRGDPYLLVTHIKENVDEVSVSAGYTYASSKPVTIIIDDKHTYHLNTTIEEMAWADSEEEDRSLVSAMQKGLNLKVSATSKKGTHSADTYSLMGFSKAYANMKKLCGKIDLTE